MGDLLRSLRLGFLGILVGVCTLPGAEAASAAGPGTADTNLAAATTSRTNPEPARLDSAARTVPREVKLTFGLDRVRFLQRELAGNPLWKYVASALFILLAFYFSKLLDYVIQVRLKKWTERTATKIDDLLLELLHGPVKIITFVIFLHVGLNIFSWPAWASRFISNSLKIVVACSLTYLALKMVGALMGVWQQKVESQPDRVLDSQLFPIIRKAVKIFIVVVAALVTCQNLGMNITGLLASLSIGGLAVSLAAQDTLSNLFGAVAIFGDKPFKVGDRIMLDSIDGTVEAIGLRSTRVRNMDGHLVTIPNRTVANASLTNVSRRPNIRTVINLGITYDTPTEKVQRASEIIREVFGKYPNTADLVLGFNKFESSSLNLLVVHWMKPMEYAQYLRGLQELNLEIKRRFDAESIQFAFPSQTVYHKVEEAPARTPALPRS